MNRMPFMKFYTADWIKGTRTMSLIQKGLWVDLLCFMWENKTRGQIEGTWEEISRLVGARREEIEGLVSTFISDGILDIVENSDASPRYAKVTDHNMKVTLISRRMKREENNRESHKIRQRNYRNRVRDKKVTLEKSEVRSQKSEKDKDSSPSDDIKNFPAFWEGYPRKAGKAAALKAWKKLSPGEDLFLTIMAAVAVQKKSRQWNDSDGQFIPHAASWLNGRRWEDQLEDAEKSDAWKY